MTDITQAIFRSLFQKTYMQIQLLTDDISVFNGDNFTWELDEETGAAKLHIWVTMLPELRITLEAHPSDTIHNFEVTSNRPDITAENNLNDLIFLERLIFGELERRVKEAGHVINLEDDDEDES